MTKRPWIVMVMDRHNWSVHSVHETKELANAKAEELRKPLPEHFWGWVKVVKVPDYEEE